MHRASPSPRLPSRTRDALAPRIASPAPTPTSAKRKSSSSSSCSLLPGDVIIETRESGRRVTFVVDKLLGKGGFATAFAVTDDAGQRYACKVVPKSKLVSSSGSGRKSTAFVKLMQEIDLHRTLTSAARRSSDPGARYVVRFERWFEDSKYVYMLLELCAGQTLMEVSRGLPRRRMREADAIVYARQLLAAMRFVHSRDVIHRDLKLSNVFLAIDGSVRLGDFGLAAKVDTMDRRKFTMCGTPNYIAPEVVNRHKLGHSFEVDIWSFGVIVFTLLVGKPPFETSSVDETYNRIKANRWSIPYSPALSQHAVNLIRSCLQPRPADRPSLSSLLRHPWILGECSSPERVSSSPALTSPAGSAVRGSRTPLRDVGNRLRGTSSPATPSSVPRMRALTPVASPTASKAVAAVATPSTLIDSRQRYVSNAATPSRRRVSTQGRTPSASAAAPVTPATARARSKRGLALTPTTPTSAATPSSAAITTAARAAVLANAAGGLATTPFVTKWVDYSNKWGLTYEVSDGSIGAYFNDDTVIVLTPATHRVRYWSQRASVPTTFILDSPSTPSSLSKKVLLLKFFRQYMQENTVGAAATSPGSAGQSSSSPSAAERLAALTSPVYVRQFVRTEKLIAFLLSSGATQVNFADHRKFVLHPDARTITVIDEQRRVAAVRATSLAPDEIWRLEKVRAARDHLLAQVRGQQASGA